MFSNTLLATDSSSVTPPDILQGTLDDATLKRYKHNDEMVEFGSSTTMPQSLTERDGTLIANGAYGYLTPSCNLFIVIRLF